MKILLVGGGSGGHVTPLKAVVDALPKKQGPYQLMVVTDRQFYKQTVRIFEDTRGTKIKRIFAGKFRRYSGKSFFWHVTHLPTILKNMRDILLLAVGSVQAVWIVLWFRPQVVFAKGGFVSVPVGLAARILRIPLVIHDSDTHPGLTNRILSRWAEVIATGMPAKYYPYDKDKMVHTGIPVSADLLPQNKVFRAKVKQRLGLDEHRPLLLVTGGGTGSENINIIAAGAAPSLVSSGWQLVHITGVGKQGPILEAREALSKEKQRFWTVLDFTDLVPYIIAADLVLTRTGASAMQEFANTQKPVITIPGKHLSGGHQVKNAALFEESGSVVVMDEDKALTNPQLLIDAVAQLFRPDGKERGKAVGLARQLHATFAKPRAAKRLAEVILAEVRTA